MKFVNNTAIERYVFDVLFKEHIPNKDLISKTEDFLFKDSLCNTIDELRRQGKIKSYKKDHVVYHFTCY